VDSGAQSSEPGERLTFMPRRALAGLVKGEPEQITLEGKQEPVLAYRVRWFAP
jgi:hypothetical protein